MPVVNLRGQPVDEAVSIKAAERFIDHFNFIESGRDTDGNITSAKDTQTGNILSFDCCYHNRAASEQFHSEMKTNMGIENLQNGKFEVKALILIAGYLTDQVLLCLVLFFLNAAGVRPVFSRKSFTKCDTLPYPQVSAMSSILESVMVRSSQLR